MERERNRRHRPLQLFFKAIQGGLGEGNIGLLVSRHGTGKRGVFVSLVVDHALQGHRSLTVAVGRSVDRIRAYQDGVLHTLMESLDLKDRASLMTRVERHRQIYSFGEDSFSLARLRETLDFLRERAQFDPEVVELVGWPDFHRLEPAEMAEVKRLAQETRCKLWLAGHSSREDVLDDRGLPPYIARHADRFSVIIGLEPERNLVRLRFLKTHDQPPPAHLNLVYDPATQLLRWR